VCGVISQPSMLPFQLPVYRITVTGVETFQLGNHRAGGYGLSLLCSAPAGVAPDRASIRNCS